MTISPWLLYLYGIADQIRFGLGLLVAVVALHAIAFLITALQNEELEKALPWLKRFYRTAIGALALWLVAILMPSSKTIALMVVIPAIVNSEPIQKDLPEIYRIAKDALKETLQVK